MTAALSGIRVLDFSRVLAAPYCTQLLGDYGADVIKVEQPGAGDGTRQWGPPWVGDQSAYFLSVNRNKRSVAIDLRRPEGQGVARELALASDIVIENFLPGQMAKFGLDYPALSALAHGLIYCSITGYGQTGPYRDRPGYDFMIQAQGGIMSITGPADGEPSKVGVAIADITTGLFAANAILAALHHRGSSGCGQYIDVALLDSQVAWLANVAHNHFAGEATRRYGNAHASIVPYQTFATEDRPIAVAVGSDGQFERFCEAIGAPELRADGRFRTNPGRVQHREELIQRIQKVLSAGPSQRWVDVLIAADVPVSPINDIPTVLADPHVLARGMVQSVADPVAGEITLLGPVAKLSETPAEIRTAPPRLGEHTDAVLREVLGKTSEEILALRVAGAVG